MYVIICGGGKVGEYLAATLLKSGNEVAVIERDLETADELSVRLEGQYLVINGDGCDSRFQEDAGVRHADVLVATTGHDDDNLVCCEIAQRVFNVPRVIARVNSPKNQRIFRACGIESISSTALIATFIEEEAMMGGVSVVSSLAHSNVALFELAVPRMHKYPHGVSVLDLPLPEGSVVVAVSGSDGAEIVTEDTFISPGEKVVIAAYSDLMDEVRAVFRSL